MSIEAERLMNKMQEYMLAYIEHAYGDYNYDELLDKGEVEEAIQYLKKALRKAEALYEAWDSLEDVKDDIINGDD